MNQKTPAKSTKPKNSVQSVERALMILGVLGEYSQGLSIADLSIKIDLPKGTTHRLLSTLAYLDYVRQDPETKKYNLGYKLVELGNRLLSHLDYRTEARPFLVRLAEATKETVHMAILDKKEILYIDKVEASDYPSGLRMASMLGARIPTHCTAVGKVILAGLPEDQAEELVKSAGMPKRTDNTITDVDKLKAHVQLVKKNGFALDNEENEIGVSCVAAPVYNQRGDVISAISISVPTSRLTFRDLKTKLKDQVMETALNISRKIGYQGGIV